MAFLKSCWICVYIKRSTLSHPLSNSSLHLNSCLLVSAEHSFSFMSVATLTLWEKMEHIQDEFVACVHGYKKEEVSGMTYEDGGYTRVLTQDWVTIREAAVGGRTPTPALLCRNILQTKQKRKGLYQKHHVSVCISEWSKDNMQQDVRYS